MQAYSRFAVYYLPPPGALARFGATWLGWDTDTGRPADQPDLPGLAARTEAPRKYGFHGTLKPPFRLAPGRDADMLHASVAQLARTLPPARCAGLELASIGRFLALRVKAPCPALERIAAEAVTGLDPYRARPSDAETARRRARPLSPRQDALLTRWGYPYVLDEFRFHLTLTGPLEPDGMAETRAWLETLLPPLPSPFPVDEIALVGERPGDGRFECLHRYPLTGPAPA